MFRRPKSPLGQIQDPFLAMQVPTSHAIFKVINILEEIITTKASEWIRWSSSAREARPASKVWRPVARTYGIVSRAWWDSVDRLVSKMQRWKAATANQEVRTVHYTRPALHLHQTSDHQT